MPSAKEIRVEPIISSDANAFVRKHHYSGKVDPRSQLHLGVFLRSRLEGVMSFGPSIDKNKSIGLVRDTAWNGFMELNRMAFSEMLPRNSESRAIAIAMKLIKKYAPHIEWILSYADGTQCGDGTIYRASGFYLTGIKKNNSMFKMPDGEVIAKIVLEPGFSPGGSGKNSIKARYGKTGTETSTAFLKRIGAERLEGFQLRYFYPLNDTVLDRLTVPILPFSKIDEMGARMYKGSRGGSIGSDAPDFLSDKSGANPTPLLHNLDE